MPPVDAQVLAMLSSVAAIFTQLLKGLLPENVRTYIPLILIAILVPLGVGLAFYTGRDPVAGALEGLFAAASAVGFYEAAHVTPGVRLIFKHRGWVGEPALEPEYE